MPRTLNHLLKDTERERTGLIPSARQEDGLKNKEDKKLSPPDSSWQDSELCKAPASLARITPIALQEDFQARAGKCKGN